LAHVVGSLHNLEHSELLIGLESGDDAAVWKLSDDQAIVSTADFITPVVDDARTWGKIAAANSLSDVYAMGGKPLFALNLVAWNSDELPRELLIEVLSGGIDIATAAGISVVGGHTISDPEPKYGMSITGIVNPDQILTNTGLLPNQELVLTKPLGIGVITTAIKRDAVGPETIDKAVASMIQLNDVAAQVALDSGATGATDVTGFGLLGHLGRMAKESSVNIVIDVDDVPLLEGSRELAEDGFISGGTSRNLSWVADHLVAGSHSEVTKLLLADAQTSGGLVFGVDPGEGEAACEALVKLGRFGAVIGRCTPGSGMITLK
jgi:selenide,water dikinase